MSFVFAANIENVCRNYFHSLYKHSESTSLIFRRKQCQAMNTNFSLSLYLHTASMEGIHVMIFPLQGSLKFQCADIKVYRRKTETQNNYANHSTNSNKKELFGSLTPYSSISSHVRMHAVSIPNENEYKKKQNKQFTLIWNICLFAACRFFDIEPFSVWFLSMFGNAPHHYHYRCITDAKRHLWVPIKFSTSPIFMRCDKRNADT